MKTITNKPLSDQNLKNLITLLFIISIVAFPMVSYAQQQSQLIELSPRITSIIDSNSRNYFYLFPGISDFQSAQTFKLSEDVYEIKIKQKAGAVLNDTILTLGSRGFNSLKNYIGNFELIGIKQQKLPPDIYQTPFIDLPKLEEMKRLEKKRKREYTEVYLTSDIYVKGKLLYANEQVLSLLKESRPYDWHNINRINRSAEKFDYRLINKITVRKKGNFGKGFGLGFLIGGGVGMLAGLIGSSGGDGLFNPEPIVYGVAGMIGIGLPSAIIGGIFSSPNQKRAEFIINGNEAIYKEALPNLNKYSSFPESKPPELNRYIKSNINEESTQLSKTSEILKNPGLHLSFLGGITLYSKASQDNYDGIISSFHKGYLGAEINYSIWEHFRGGLFYQKFARISEHNIKQINQSYGISMDYIPKPVYKYLNFSKRGEFAIGAGLSLNKILIENYFDSKKSNRPAGHLRCSYDYYFSRGFSMQLKSDIRIMPSVKISQDKYNLYNNNLSKVNFSGWVLGFGLRLHI